MNKENLSKLSNEQKALLNNEILIAEILEIRNPKDTLPPPSKPGWQKFLESSGGAALITVVLGGIMGSLITATFQLYAKQREMDLAAYQQKLGKRQETMKAAYDLVGFCSAPADNLIRYKLTAGNDISKYTDKEKKKIKEKEWSDILDKFEAAQQKWSSEEQQTILSLSYNYENNKEVKDAWKQVGSSLSDYFACVKKCIPNLPEVCKTCEEKRKTFGENTEYLGCTVEKASKETGNTQITCTKSTQASQ